MSVRFEKLFHIAYDWGNAESETGASEYIVVPGASYEIERVIPTMQYGK